MERGSLDASTMRSTVHLILSQINVLPPLIVFDLSVEPSRSSWSLPKLLNEIQFVLFFMFISQTHHTLVLSSPLPIIGHLVLQEIAIRWQELPFCGIIIIVGSFAFVHSKATLYFFNHLSHLLLERLHSAQALVSLFSLCLCLSLSASVSPLSLSSALVSL